MYIVDMSIVPVYCIVLMWRMIVLA